MKKKCLCDKRNMVIGDSDLRIWDSNMMICQEYVRETPAAPPLQTSWAPPPSKVLLLNTTYCSFNFCLIVTHFNFKK